MSPDLYPAQASEEAEALVEAAVKSAEGAWGQRQLPELQAEDLLAFACEKAPTDDQVNISVHSLPSGRDSVIQYTGPKKCASRLKQVVGNDRTQKKGHCKPAPRPLVGPAGLQAPCPLAPSWAGPTLSGIFLRRVACQLVEELVVASRGAGVAGRLPSQAHCREMM